MKVCTAIAAITIALTASPVLSASQASSLTDLQGQLEAKQRASEKVYQGHSKEEVTRAILTIFDGMDHDYNASLTDKGVAAYLSWTTYVVLGNVFGKDYWSVSVTPTESGGATVPVNAISKSSGGLFVTFPPDQFIDDIPIVAGAGLTVEEMELFHRRLAASLAGDGVETCKQAFGGKAKKYALTCGRGGVTYTTKIG